MAFLLSSGQMVTPLFSSAGDAVGLAVLREEEEYFLPFSFTQRAREKRMDESSKPLSRTCPSGRITPRNAFPSFSLPPSAEFREKE